jgi:putative serine protease PepD
VHYFSASQSAPQYGCKNAAQALGPFGKETTEVNSMRKSMPASPTSAYAPRESACSITLKPETTEALGICPIFKQRCNKSSRDCGTPTVGAQWMAVHRTPFHSREVFMRSARMLAAAAFFAITLSSANAQTTPPTLSGDEVVDRVSPAVVLILVSSGDGQVSGIGSGLIVRSDGIVLTANHVVKGMREVQVRLKGGDVYDRVELIAADERRDIAALRIPAAGLTALPAANSSDARPGSPVYVVSNGAGLPWTTSSGVLSAARMADEVPGAGSGYRLLQFTASLSPGSSGGVLVDAQARALGIVVGFITPGQNVNFAVPLDTVAGLASASGGTPFASGARLQLPTASQTGGVPGPGTAARNLPAAPAPELPRRDQMQIRTVSVHSKTIYIRRERLQDDIHKTAMFPRLGMRFADYGQTADIAITVDRPAMTFDWTYTLVYQPKSLTLASGTVEATDEFDAGPKLAAVIVEQLATAVQLPREQLDKPTGTSAANDMAIRESGNDPAGILRSARSIFVESHTIWMKGNLLQDALYTRPEMREWGIRIVDDRDGADIYIDVTRPFLTYDWIFKMINPKTGTVLGTGKVTAIDGPGAAQRLAIDIVNQIRGVRPVPATP